MAILLLSHLSFSQDIPCDFNNRQLRIYLNHLESMERENRKMKSDSLNAELKRLREVNSIELKLYKLDVKLKRDSIDLISREIAVKRDSIRLLGKLYSEETKRHEATENRLKMDIVNERKKTIALSDDIKTIELALAKEREKISKLESDLKKRESDNHRKVVNVEKRNKDLPLKWKIIGSLCIIGSFFIGIFIGKLIDWFRSIIGLFKVL